jgi:hypothetical protein
LPPGIVPYPEVYNALEHGRILRDVDTWIFETFIQDP